MEKAILYLHGQGGSAAEAARFQPVCPGYAVLGVDYALDSPWRVTPVLRAAYAQAAEAYGSLTLLANSIGAFYAMHALGDCPLERALFISPILDMEALIRQMMERAGVSEEALSRQGEVVTGDGETLSWDYLQYVRANPVRWPVPTRILYAAGDHLTARRTVDAFAAAHSALVTVMPGGEHWFHTGEQLAFLDRWLRQALR